MTEKELILSTKSRKILIEARAGTGKTTALVDFSKSKPRETFLYLSYNNSLKQEARRKFGGNVTNHTIHSLAYESIGYIYKEKLGELSVKDIIKHCFSDQEIDIAWSNAYFVLNELKLYFQGSDQLSDKALEYWDLMCDPYSEAPMSHDGYLRLYHLSNPELKYDWIMIDEAQDADKIALDIVLSQDSGLLIVGDTYQEIYGFRGVDNVFKRDLDFDRFRLSKSWRFGESIACVANAFIRDGFEVRGDKEEDYVLYNDGSLKDTVICRTNAHLLELAFQAVKEGKQIHIIGGMKNFDDIEDIYRLYKGELYKVRNSYIRSFRSFYKLKEFAEKCEDRDLIYAINIIERIDNIFDVIKEIEKRTRKAHLADVVFSTAHRSKGLQFSRVRIANDFPKIKKDLGYEEFNLMYVAVTRAEHTLYLPDSFFEFLNKNVNIN